MTAAIIGCGRMGREHAEAYVEMGVPISAVYDLDFYKAQAFAQEFGCEVSSDIVGRINADFVSICSWDDAHASQIIGAKGCRVIAEKPICIEPADLHRLASINGLTCNLPLRWVDTDPLKPYHVEAQYLWGRADQLTGWRAACPGYSFVLGGGVHVADLICRRGRPLFVSAHGQATHGFPAPTMIVATGQYDDGRTFGISINCANIGSHEFHLTEWLPRGRREQRGSGTDKRETIRKVVRGEKIDDPAGLAAHALCFAIEAALKNRRVEQVIYPTEA